MRRNINDYSPLEAQDEIVFSIFERILKRAKAAAEKAQAAERMVFKALEDMCIVPEDVPTGAENAENLEEAITCYLEYDEYSVAGIMKEVREAYGKEG